MEQRLPNIKQLSLTEISREIMSSLDILVEHLSDGFIPSR